ncbi:Holliday junction recognition protein isoform X1 [Zalophus californianus]|uniref:Holliday junction recognition protein isoform X1 n=1 Tax=Zalophus californianus TaxID=9704 RepID=A0A6J2CTE1_ZALCA|nr:Holliday junction recognition protein isoform X1 [Zalophus californianus]
MEDQLLGDDALLWKLRDSRRRFQRHMQRLIEKYDQPFEDAPLVQMSTLTYETPQGLRIWGGGLVKERNKGHIQDSLVETVGRSGGSPTEASASGPAPPVPGTRVLAVDSKSNDDTSLYQEDVVAGSFMPAVPWSPLKNELRRKYLTQVDALLQDEGCSECTDDGDGEDTRVTLTPSLASPARPTHGSRGRVPGRSPGGPVKPASCPRECDPSRPCSADLAIMPRSDSLSLRGARGNSSSSSPAFEADNICDVTISDLYAGMLHSMSRLLSTKPSCIISTKTSFIAHSRSSRRRHKYKNRMNRTHCQGGGPSRRGSQETPPPCSEPLRDGEVLRDRENLLDASDWKAGLKLEKAFPEVNKPEIHELEPSWKELKGLQSLMPRRCSSLTYGGASAMHHRGQENRLMALKWLISPVKIISRPRILPGKGGNRYREIEIKFDKLHQEYCPRPGKEPCLTCLPGPSAVAVYRGGPASFDARGLSRPFGRAEARRFHEAFEDLGERAIGAARCLPKRGAPPLLSETSSVQSPGCSEQTLDLLFPGNDLGTLGKSISPSKATSVAGGQPLHCGRNRYNAIKEKFDKFYQQYCQQSLQWTRAPLRSGTSPDRASVQVQYPKGGTLEKSNPDSVFQGPPKLSASPQWSVESPLSSTTLEAQPSMRFGLTARRGRQSPLKRRRLSDSLLYGQWANSQDPPCVLGRAIEQPAPNSPPGKRRFAATSSHLLARPLELSGVTPPPSSASAVPDAPLPPSEIYLLNAWQPPLLHLPGEGAGSRVGPPRSQP